MHKGYFFAFPETISKVCEEKRESIVIYLVYFGDLVMVCDTLTMVAGIRHYKYSRGDMVDGYGLYASSIPLYRGP